ASAIGLLLCFGNCLSENGVLTEEVSAYFVPSTEIKDGEDIGDWREDGLVQLAFCPEPDWFSACFFGCSGLFSRCGFFTFNGGIRIGERLQDRRTVALRCEDGLCF